VLDFLLIQPWYAANGHPYSTTNILLQELSKISNTRAIVLQTSADRVPVPISIENLVYSKTFPLADVLSPFSTIYAFFCSLFIHNSKVRYWCDCDPMLVTILEIFRLKKSHILVSLLNPPSRMKRWKIFLMLLSKKLNRELTYVVRTERIKTQWIKRGINQDSIIVLPSTIIDPTANITTCRKFVSSPIELLMFGQIRKGKSIEQVIGVMQEINGFNLTICGPTLNDDYAYELSQLASQSQRVSLDIGFLDTEEVNTKIIASDFLLILYDDAWDPDMESGIVHLAVQFQKPIICFDGCWIADVTKEYDLGYILRRKDPLACQLNNLRVTMSRNELAHFSGIDRFTHELGTTASVEKLFCYYRAVLR
jgi:hypothetical protein